LVSAAKQSIIGGSDRLFLIAGGNRSLLTHKRLIMHMYKNPLQLGTLPAALEGGLDVSIPAVASQGKADPDEYCLGVSSRRIIVSEKASIRRDSQPALTQHYKAAKCRNGVGVEMH
jgi:hypothetical protein